MKLILASKSPRRIELMRMLGVSFEVKVSNCDESCVGDAVRRVRELAYRKALAVAREMDEPCYVLAADTLVEREGIIFGKPEDEQEARKMLRALSGGWHEVHSGVALVDTRRMDAPSVFAETARVHFAKIREEEIAAYVSSGEPMDKAGAYAIQGKAGAFIDRIEGDYYAIVGLPLCRVRELLQGNGVYNASVADTIGSENKVSI